MGFPSDSVIKNLIVNARDRRYRFDPWAGKIPWSRKLHSTPVFLPVKFQEQRSLAGYSPWGLQKSEMTEHACTQGVVVPQYTQVIIPASRESYLKWQKRLWQFDQSVIV